MDARAKGKLRYRRRVHVDEPHARVFRKHVAAAVLAPLAVTVLRFIESADMVGPLHDLQRLGFPQSERVDGPGRPASARFTMAVTHAGGFTADREFDGAAEAAPLIYVFRSHDFTLTQRGGARRPRRPGL